MLHQTRRHFLGAFAGRCQCVAYCVFHSRLEPRSALYLIRQVRCSLAGKKQASIAEIRVIGCNLKLLKALAVVMMVCVIGRWIDVREVCTDIFGLRRIGHNINIDYKYLRYFTKKAIIFL